MTTQHRSGAGKGTPLENQLCVGVLIIVCEKKKKKKSMQVRFGGNVRRWTGTLSQDDPRSADLLTVIAVQPLSLSLGLSKGWFKPLWLNEEICISTLGCVPWSQRNEHQMGATGSRPGGAAAAFGHVILNINARISEFSDLFISFFFSSNRLAFCPGACVGCPPVSTHSPKHAH